MARIKRAQADRIVREHVLWAIGAGFIPIPMADFATVTGIQVDMLNKLSGLYDVEYAASTGKSLVAALTGTTFAEDVNNLARELAARPASAPTS